MGKFLRKSQSKRVMAGILAIVMVLSSINFTHFVSAEAATEYVTLYFIDKTADQWVKNDNAQIKAIDNTNGHEGYWMTQINDTVWSVEVPSSAYNITFYRYSSDQMTQWNSWSAGGRDGNNAYYAEGHEYGYWGTEEIQEEGFQTGDIIYLDISEFTQWTNDNAKMYINFSSATKSESNGKDIYIPSASQELYFPQLVTDQKGEYMYTYTVTEEDAGAKVLRFWRGNGDTLWNCSSALTYKEYKSGYHGIKVSGWNEQGSLMEVEEEIQLQIETEDFTYNETLGLWECTEIVDNLSGMIEPASYVKKLEYVVTDVMENQVKTGEIPVAANWSISDFGMADGYNRILITATSKAGIVYEETIEVFNTEEENSQNIFIDKADDDEDGLNNYQEALFGTDKDNCDTDGDNLSDFDELILFGTNPLKVDVNEDGVSYEAEDADRDNIPNTDEMSCYQTNPLVADTDGDGLKDGDEINQYQTDPLLEDTDEDGLKDGDECLAGTNPLEADSDEDGAKDGWEVENGYNPLVYNDSFLVKVSISHENINANVEMITTGTNTDTVSISEVDNYVLLDENMPGYIGPAFNFEAKETFEEATIRFEFKEELLENENFQPTIYYFNEETQLLEELDTILEGNIASTVVEHFSTYVLLNKVDFDKVWKEDIRKPGKEENHGISVAFVLDRSASMSWNDPENLRNSLTTQFIDKLTMEKDLASVISFTKISEVRMELSNDMEALKKAVEAIVDDSGYNYHSGTDGTIAIYESIQQLVADDSGNARYIIFMTDGADTYRTYFYEELIETAKENDIVIYTIGLGAVDEEILQKLADETGGKHLYAAAADELYEAFIQAEDETIDYHKDSNQDGISDYYTKLMCEGLLVSGSGIGVFKGCSYEAVQQSDDYDNDGLKNGEEIVIGEILGRVYMKVKSLPTSKDSDKDGVDDLHDANPLVKAANSDKYKVTEMDFYGTVQKIEDFRNGDYADGKREKEYGTGQYTKEEKQEIYKKYLMAKQVATGVEIATMVPMIPDSMAAKTLEHYLDNTGTDYIINTTDMEQFITQQTLGKETYNTNKKQMGEYFLDTLKDGESMTIVTDEAFVSLDNTISGIDPYRAANWFATLGNSSGYMVATATRSDNVYTMKTRYIIYDYYDWNATDTNVLVWGLSNNIMWKMTNMGIAKPYFIYGEISHTYSFTKTTVNLLY